MDSGRRANRSIVGYDYGGSLRGPIIISEVKPMTQFQPGYRGVNLRESVAGYPADRATVLTFTQTKHPGTLRDTP